MGKKKSSRGKPSTPGQKSPAKRLQKQSTPSSREHAERREGMHLKKAEDHDIAVASTPSAQANNKTFPIVGIGASAGGLEAFSAFLKALRVDTGMAFVLVQHMDPTHESLLNQLLAKQTAMPVIQVKDGMAVEPNCVYVIPPNSDMTIRDGKLRLVACHAGVAPHNPIDSFLCALAEDQRTRAIGVILSGIGSDGTKGLQAIKTEGGVTFAQDEMSARYSGMPMNAAATGCVDLVLSPDKISRELARMSRHPYLEVAQPPISPELPPGKDANLFKIFRVLRSATGVDFMHYKQTTIQRRISRRMMVRRCETLGQYVKYLEAHPDEAKDLFQDVLIHVTAFFREPKVLQTLQKMIFPRIIASLPPGKSVRFWVPGCSSGEEVYSIAFALREHLGEAAASTAMQIFGTDISDSNIQIARAAIYSQNSTAGLSSERLKRFFVKTEGGYQVVKPIREMCVFARHDLTKDPPFSRMDLISCRNVLIYLQPTLQRKVLDFLHYALKPSGFLILGKSEGVSASRNLFVLEDRKANIYSKLQAVTRPLPEFRVVEHEKSAEPLPSAPQLAPLSELRKTVERMILDRYAPSGLIVDPRLRIIHFQGDTSSFLRPASGEPSFDLLKLVRPELMLEIRSAVQEAKKLGIPARREGISFKRNGKVHRTDIEIVPIESPTGKGTVYLVLFRNQRASIEEKLTPASVKKAAMKAEIEERERLRKQVTSLQGQLRSLMEDHEAATEELRAANEEILSSNEELRSTNEELQTAKEELQSTNEELTTLNDELQNRNLELSQTASDLNSLLNAVEIPIVILGNDRSIRRFTPTGEKLLNLISSDVGRPIGQIRTNIEIPDLDQMASEVIERGVSVEREVRDHKGHWYALRMRPYVTAEDRIEGILIVLVDIHDIKQYATAIIETMRGCLLVLDSHFRVLLASPGFYKTFEVKREETESRLLWELGSGQWNILQLRELLEKVLPEKQEVVDYEVEHDFPSIGRKTMLLNARQLYPTESGSPKILLVIEDITARKVEEEKSHQLTARLMTTAEDERKRIARELHDSFGPRLASLNLQVSQVKDLLSSQPDLAEEVDKARNQIGDLAKATHDLSQQLHPSVLSQLGLKTALESECASYSQQYGIAVSFSTKNVPERIPDSTALCLYRVAQAGLENIRKHAQTQEASITLAGKGNEIVMIIRDFGKGFDLEAARTEGGLGLVSMEERVRLANGRLRIKSKPGEGTKVEVRIPLEN